MTLIVRSKNGIFLDAEKVSNIKIIKTKQMNDQDKIAQIKQMIETACGALAHAKKLANEIFAQNNNNHEEGEGAENQPKTDLITSGVSSDGRVIEGIFDGLNMIGPAGKQYVIPQNYASKSKLVEGDRLKLTINDDGSFLYKQIGPVERKRLVGFLTHNGDGEEYRVLAQGKSYHVILASVTYFRGEAGDEAVILVPRDREVSWAAVENIIKKSVDRPRFDAESPMAAATDLEKESATVALKSDTPITNQVDSDLIEEI